MGKRREEEKKKERKRRERKKDSPYLIIMPRIVSCHEPKSCGILMHYYMVIALPGIYSFPIPLLAPLLMLPRKRRQHLKKNHFCF